jgi:dTDP-3-amino-3,4,6-trideoxy-alpha-D-glucose transaminase
VIGPAPAVPFRDLAGELDQIRDELDEAVRAVLDSGWFVLGPELEAFEEEFAAYCGAQHCVGVSSGTDALVLALRACGVGPGDEVITPSFTFFAGPYAIVAVGATPVFVDVDEVTATLDADKAREAITPKTRAIVPVHLYGRCAELSGLAALAADHDLWLIEDAAQAHGARANGQRAGTAGQLGCFSFYPSKNLGALGDGGAVVTDQPDLAARLRLLRNYGQSDRYRHELMAPNARLDELQAAVLRRKLPHLDAWNEARRRTAHTYAARLGPTVHTPGTSDEDGQVFHLYVIRTEGRDALRRYLAEHGVQTGIHYPVPAHRQPALAQVPHVEHDLRVTDELARTVLSLPMFPTISDEQVGYVADRVRCGLSEIAA